MTLKIGIALALLATVCSGVPPIAVSAASYTAAAPGGAVLHQVGVPAGSNPANPQVPEHWREVSRIAPGTKVEVQLEGKPRDRIAGQYSGLDSQALKLERRRLVESIALEDIDRIWVREKTSRWKDVGIGALIGFAIGFVPGALAAGHISDQNNPGFQGRAEVGASTGLIGAGIGAAIGAAAGGSRYVRVYDRGRGEPRR